LIRVNQKSRPEAAYPLEILITLPGEE